MRPHKRPHTLPTIQSPTPWMDDAVTVASTRHIMKSVPGIAFLTLSQMTLCQLKALRSKGDGMRRLDFPNFNPHF